MAPIDIYVIPICPSCRSVKMVASYLGIPLNVKNVDTTKGENKTPEFKKMNPQSSLPTIDDDGFYLWESRAVMTYLANKYAQDSPVYPRDPKKRAIVDKMLYFDVGTLYKAESECLYPVVFQRKPMDPEKEEAFKKSLEFLEGFLGKTSYAACNTITLADLAIISTLSFAQLADYSFGDFPKITAYMKKLKEEIPSYREINDDPLNQYKESMKSKK